MNTKVFKRLTAFLLAMIMLFSFAACGGGNEDDETTAEETTTQAVTEAEITSEEINRLTGLPTLSEEAYGKRPVAIMINNIKAALPQYGISDADLMFELVVEGGITRMMAVYGDYTKIPNVCSVRSCRYYYPILAHGLDAVYICFGSNPTLGTPTLEKLGIDYFDGSAKYDTGLFGRDAARLKKYSSEHTAFVKGENIPEFFESKGIRTDYKDGRNETIFNFREEAVAAGDTSCDRVRLNFSNAYYSTFVYDSEEKVFYKQHNGNAQMDTSTNEQLNYTNVFVLETDVSVYKNGPLMKIGLKGGSGYYISMGKYQEITWSKASDEDPIEVFDSEGNPLDVNPGKSYIGILQKGATTIRSAEEETTAANS